MSVLILGLLPNRDMAAKVVHELGSVALKDREITIITKETLRLNEPLAAERDHSQIISGVFSGETEHTLTSLGVPLETARQYEESVVNGVVLLIAHTDEEKTAIVTDLLDKHGAFGMETVHLEPEGKLTGQSAAAYFHDIEKDEDPLED